MGAADREMDKQYSIQSSQIPPLGKGAVRWPVQTLPRTTEHDARGPTTGISLAGQETCLLVFQDE